MSDLQIPVEKDGAEEYVKVASQKLQLGIGDIIILKILSKSIDTLNKEQFYYKLSLVVTVADNFENKQNLPEYVKRIEQNRKPAWRKERPIVVGFGPAGMFAALELIDYGLKPIIFERGKIIEERSVDV
ncbi:MAG: dehydrogenase, partial [Desulfobulbaceae bacterium]|nr:dehydrogenase [Desulfobulbaceae bacterium]